MAENRPGDIPIYVTDNTKITEFSAWRPEITVPTLLITGDTDVVVATADTEALATMIEGSSLVVIPRSGHLAQEETPAETMKAIEDYWKTLQR
jgi:pimeloyl-ACP methyl ester carboxylesterase